MDRNTATAAPRRTDPSPSPSLLAAALALAGCQTATGPLGEVAAIDAAQGSSENISSLTAVIQRSPNDPEAYNVRGSAYGRGGRYQEALADFDTAIAAQPELPPGLRQPRADPSLHGQPGRPRSATTTAPSSSTPNYDAAYIGRGNLYRLAGRSNEAFSDFERAIQLDTTDPRAYYNRGLLYQTRGQHDYAIEDFATVDLAGPERCRALYAARGLSYLALQRRGQRGRRLQHGDQARPDQRRGLGLPGAGA